MRDVCAMQIASMMPLFATLTSVEGTTLEIMTTYGRQRIFPASDAT
jgi:hypothetical protein